MSNGKRAIVTLANNASWYRKGQERMIHSLGGRFTGKIFPFKSEQEVGAKPHSISPYGFKVHAFDHAFNHGYDLVLWIDSSVYCIRDTESVFATIHREGYIMQEAGHMVGTWANDASLEYFGITRDEAMKMPMYGNAGFLGLKKGDETAMEFLKRWRDAEKSGIFKGDWKNDSNSESKDPRCKGHRHDMTCGSIIANQLDMKYKRAGQWLQYKPEFQPPKHENIIFGAHPAT